MNTTPFLSIIIPAYNCRETIERLLNSILSSHMEKEELEVILCDDKSTDNFLELVKPYESSLNIIYCTTERDIHCPGNTREAALKYAKGTWITFIDNDDMFEPGALSSVKTYIEEHNIHFVLCTSFREWNPFTKVYTKTFIGEQTDTWLHGKFFNRRNLLERFHIHFKDDLFSHEDVFFNSTVLGNLIGNNTDYIYYNIYTYRWITNPKSLSRSYFNTDHYYIETYLNDYIVGVSEPYFWMIEKYPEKKSFYVHQIMMAMLHSFFYFDSCRYRLGHHIISDNIKYLHDFKVKICEQLHISEWDIIHYIYANPELYANIKKDSVIGTNNFIETQSFRDFILSI